MAWLSNRVLLHNIIIAVALGIVVVVGMTMQVVGGRKQQQVDRVQLGDDGSVVIIQHVEMEDSKLVVNSGK